MYRNMVVEEEEINWKGSFQQTHRALLDHVMDKRALSKAIVSMKYEGVRASQNEIEFRAES